MHLRRTYLGRSVLPYLSIGIPVAVTIVCVAVGIIIVATARMIAPVVTAAVMSVTTMAVTQTAQATHFRDGFSSANTATQQQQEESGKDIRQLHDPIKTQKENKIFEEADPTTILTNFERCSFRPKNSTNRSIVDTWL